MVSGGHPDNEWWRLFLTFGLFSSSTSHAFFPALSGDTPGRSGTSLSGVPCTPGCRTFCRWLVTLSSLIISYTRLISTFLVMII